MVKIRPGRFDRLTAAEEKLTPILYEWKEMNLSKSPKSYERSVLVRSRYFPGRSCKSQFLSSPVIRLVVHRRNMFTIASGGNGITHALPRTGIYVYQELDE